MKRSWRTACEDAGVPGRLMRDLRRTAVRNLERAGVSRSVAMKMTGHKTAVRVPALRHRQRGGPPGGRRETDEAPAEGLGLRPRLGRRRAAAFRSVQE